MYKKLFIILFVIIFPYSALANNASELYNNEDYDAAYRAAYADALSGDSESKFIIGKILIDGKGSSKKSIKQGIKFLQDAADNDYLKAVIFLAKLYEEGKYASKSNSRSLKYYEQCEKLGGSSSCTKKVTKKRIATSGAVSKKSCERYNKSSKKLANTIARCIANGYLDGVAHDYFFIAFDNGNNDAFLSASRDILKSKSKSDLMKIIKRIPKFDKKASKKQRQVFKNLLLDYGFATGECGTAKNALGFSKKGDVPSCVLSAAAGNQKTSTTAAIWWRDGLHGLPKSKRYSQKMIDQAQDGVETDIAGILEILKVDPRAHFKKAKEFLIDNPMNRGLVAKAFKLELEMLAEKKHQEYASSVEDVADVIGIVDWSVIEPKKLSKFVYLYYTELNKIKELNTDLILENIEKLPFSEEMYRELVKQGQGAGRLANVFLSEKMFIDCNAFGFVSKNKQLVSLEKLKLAQKEMIQQCKLFNTEPKSMKALLEDGLNDIEAVKIPIELMLNQRLACTPYSDFLEYSELPVPNDYFDVDFERLNDLCSKYGIVSYSLAKIAFANALKQEDQLVKENEFSKAFKYSKKACLSDQSRGCELVSSMIINNQSSEASQYAFNEREPAAITFLEKGHKSGDIKSTAMLFDIYDQTFSSVGNTKKALELLDELKKSDQLSAEIRVRQECFKNRKLDLLKFVTQNCTSVCIWAKNTFQNKSLDQGSVRTLENILKREICNR